VGTSVVDVDVHEMLTSVKALAPYLDEPWRSRVAINDGFKGPPGNPYAFPQATGVAIADAVTDDGVRRARSWSWCRSVNKVLGSWKDLV
jgi:hypothetical protein